MLSLTLRRPPPKHRRPTGRRLPRRAGQVVTVGATFAVATAVTVHLSAGQPPALSSAASSAASTAALSSTRTGGALSALVLGRPATSHLGGPGRSSEVHGTTTYAGAEQRTVLERREPTISRSASRVSTVHGRLSERAQSRPAPPTWSLPVSGYHLTAGFGECSGLWGHCHTGLDFAAPTGTPVRAVAAGTITEVGWAGAYGNRTVETLEDGTEIWYCHQDSVVIGLHDRVAVGQQVGRIGSTGNTTGPHLHLEVRPGGGDPVDPFAFLSAHGVTP